MRQSFHEHDGRTTKAELKRDEVDMARPSKYKKEYCDMLIEHMAKGLSFECFAADLRVCKQTLYTWTEKHPEFLDAKRHGEIRCMRWWESLGCSLASGNRQGNAAVFIFNMKNRFGWRDKQEITGSDGDAVKLVIERSKKSDDNE